MLQQCWCYCICGTRYSERGWYSVSHLVLAAKKAKAFALNVGCVIWGFLGLRLCADRHYVYWAKKLEIGTACKAWNHSSDFASQEVHTIGRVTLWCGNTWTLRGQTHNSNTNGVHTKSLLNVLPPSCVLFFHFFSFLFLPRQRYSDRISC